MLSVLTEKRVHPITDQAEWPFARPAWQLVAPSHPLHLIRQTDLDSALTVLIAGLTATLATYQPLIGLNTDRLVGRDTAGSGGIEEISVTAGIGFTGSAAIGLVDAGVTLAKMADLSASRVIGRAFGAGTGVPTALVDTQIATIVAGLVDPAAHVHLAAEITIDSSPWAGALVGYAGSGGTDELQDFLNWFDTVFDPPPP